MRIKMGKEMKYSLLIFVSLLIAMQLEMNRILLLIALSMLLFIANNVYRGKNKKNSMYELQKICRTELLLLALFIGIQVAVIELSIKEIATNIAILTCVYIGIIVGSLCMKPYRSFETYLRAALMFLIVFSAYYLFDIIVHGLPEGRNSVLGNVSSNYCSAVLFMNYPVLFYYLFARTEKENRNKKLVKYCYIAIVLSMMVIISTGSRTAIGVVTLMVAQMLLYKQERARDKIKFVAVAIVGLLVIILAYRYSPSVHSLVYRALGVFEGKSIWDSNVRHLIWAAGLQQFHGGNDAFGLGTNIVTRYDRSAHNLFYEVLLCSGYVGIVFFVVSNAVMLIFIFKKQKYKQRFFSVMLLMSAMIVALVQPFFSTSYTCGMMLWMSLFSLMADAERNTL